MKTLLSMAPVSVVAWTGGSSPAKPSQVSAKQAGIQKFLFGQQVETFRAYWGDNPNWDTLHIFFRRARMDAHATIRDESTTAAEAVRQYLKLSQS